MVAEVLDSASAAAISVSEGVVVGESSGRGSRCRGRQMRRCYVHGRRQRRRCYMRGWRCVVGGRKGVDGVWSIAAMAAAAMATAVRELTASGAIAEMAMVDG